MRIVELKIENFRGLSNFYYRFESRQDVVCLIGKNDSKKSTLLKAIELLFWPSNYLGFLQDDFTNNNVENSIKIEATFTDFPDDFLLLNKYGYYLTKPGLRNPSPEDNIEAEDLVSFREPDGGPPFYLRAQLRVDSSLEPEWFIVSDDQEPIRFRQSDRKQLSVNSIGFSGRRDFSWGQNSILKKYFIGKDYKNELRQWTLQALKNVSIDNSEIADDFNESLKGLPKLMRAYGLDITDQLSNRIDIRNSDPAIAVFEGEVPLAARGLGAQRLASIALNMGEKAENSITLIDEIETSLEPFRLQKLISILRTNTSKTGQVFYSTHSPSVLNASKLDEIFIMGTDGIQNQKLVRISDVPLASNVLGSTFRRSLNCLLGRKIIICEGSTEEAYARAIDRKYYPFESADGFAVHGVEIISAAGEDNVPCTVKFLRELGYPVCVIMDNDKLDAVEKVQKLEDRYSDILILLPDSGLCFEQQICNDAPEAFLRGIPEYLEQLNLNDSAKKRFQKLCNENVLNRDEIGITAKEKKGLFKNYGNGELLLPVLLDCFETSKAEKESLFYKNLIRLREWIEDDSKLY